MKFKTKPSVTFHQPNHQPHCKNRTHLNLIHIQHQCNYVVNENHKAYDCVNYHRSMLLIVVRMVNFLQSKTKERIHMNSKRIRVRSRPHHICKRCAILKCIYFMHIKFGIGLLALFSVRSVQTTYYLQNRLYR